MIAPASAGGITWDTEVCVFSGASRERLVEQLRQVDGAVGAMACELKDVAYTLATGDGESAHRMAIVATSIADLRKKIGYGVRRLGDPACMSVNELAGVHYFAQPLAPAGKVVFLFPGEGSQYPNMLADLCLHLP